MTLPLSRPRRSEAPTALIADDEEGPRAALRAALAAVWPSLKVVAEAVHGPDAWDAFLAHEPDVCFLDIRMPGFSGLDVAQRIGDRAAVVFVTAYGDHAISAFDAGAIDYLMKPVDRDRLRQTADRLQQRWAASDPPTGDLGAVLAALAAQARRRVPLQVLQASVGREVKLIHCDDVVYFESDARYTRVVHAGGEALLRMPLKDLLAQLDETLFWQVHRSVIVNHRHIASAVRVDEGQMHLTLRGRSETLPVSRHFQAMFKGQ